MRGKARRADPRQHKKPRLAHDEAQMGEVLEPLQADPPSGLVQAAGGEVEQQAAERALVAVAQEVAQIGSQRLAVAERMVALDPLVGFFDALRLVDGFQPPGRQVGGRAVRGPGRIGFCGPRPGPRLGGRARMPSRSRSVSKR